MVGWAVYYRSSTRTNLYSVSQEHGIKAVCKLACNTKYSEQRRTNASLPKNHFPSLANPLNFKLRSFAAIWIHLSTVLYVMVINCYGNSTSLDCITSFISLMLTPNQIFSTRRNFSSEKFLAQWQSSYENGLCFPLETTFARKLLEINENMNKFGT